MDHVHLEGRTGDFARTGMLYLIETASSSADLELWMVDSDLATYMASALGALYSSLSSKLILSHRQGGTPSILVLSDYAPAQPFGGAEASTSPDFEQHLEAFMSNLLFWQDVLEHCKSDAVKQSLLDHFQILFLEQVLSVDLVQ